MNEISSCLGSLLCPDLGKFFPWLAVSWFLCRQFTCDFKPLATSQLHWMALCSPHHKLGLKLPVIQDSSCLERGVSCIFQTVPVWHSAFMKFLCLQACRVCMWKYVCRTEVHLMYSTQSSHLFFFFSHRVSHWSRSLSVWIDRLPRKPLLFYLICGIPDVSWEMAVTGVLNAGPHASHQGLYQLGHLRSPRFMFLLGDLFLVPCGLLVHAMWLLLLGDSSKFFSWLLHYFAADFLLLHGRDLWPEFLHV